MFIKRAIVTALLLSSANVMAGGAASNTATETTQMMNNGELIANTAKQAEQVAMQAKDFTVQYDTWYKNLMSKIPLSQIQAYTAPYRKLASDAADIYKSANDVYISGTRAYQTLEWRRQEMIRLGKNPTAYLKSEMELAKWRGGTYRKQMEYDRKTLQDAEEKSKKLNEVMDRTGSLSGQIEGFQTLSQLNQMSASELIKMNATISQQALLVNQEKADKAAFNERIRQDAINKQSEVEKMRQADKEFAGKSKENFEQKQEALFKSKGLIK